MLKYSLADMCLHMKVSLFLIYLQQLKITKHISKQSTLQHLIFNIQYFLFIIPKKFNIISSFIVTQEANFIFKLCCIKLKMHSTHQSTHQHSNSKFLVSCSLFLETSMITSIFIFLVVHLAKA